MYVLLVLLFFEIFDMLHVPGLIQDLSQFDKCTAAVYATDMNPQLKNTVAVSNDATMSLPVSTILLYPFTHERIFCNTGSSTQTNQFIHLPA